MDPSRMSTLGDSRATEEFEEDVVMRRECEEAYVKLDVTIVNVTFSNDMW